MKRTGLGIVAVTAALAASFEPTAEASVEVTPAIGDHSGTYVLVQQTTTVAEVPIVADVVARTRAISLQRLRARGDRLEGQGTLCHLEMESSSSLVKTEFPPAFRRALPPVRTDARLEKQGDVLFFRQAKQTLVVGARLSKPDEPLPTQADDRRVFDADGDGRPGVTVRISGIVSGDIHLVQRSTSRLSGAKTKGGFRGRIEFQSEQSILSATSSFLESAPEAKPDWSQSFFQLEKVSDSASCEDARRVARGIR